MNNQIKTVLLLGVLSAILIGIGGLIGKTWLIVMTAVAVAMNLGAYFFSDRIVLRLHRARELSESEAPQLHALVYELSMRAGIPKPRVFLVPSLQPNAFATGRSPEKGVIAVTEGLMSLLTTREVRGVIAHELAHIRNRDVLVSTIAAAVAAAIGSIANLLQFSAIFGGSDEEEGPSPLAALGLALVAPLAATLIQLGVSRSREYLADETGAVISGDPDALASALEKLEHGAAAVLPPAENPAASSLYIVNPLTGAEGVMGLFSTHPPTPERVRRLRTLMWKPQRFAA